MLRVFGLGLILSAVAVQTLAFYGLSRQNNPTDILYNSTEVKACDAGIAQVCIGCKTFRICTGAPVAEDNPQSECPTDKPYCQTQSGECAIDPDNFLRQCGDAPPTNSTPAPTKPAFECTGAGKFPDPYDCSKYYNCEKAGIAGDSYDCPPNYSYDVSSQNCQLMAEGCKPIDCSASEFIYNEYPTDPQYFYYCKFADSSMPDALPTVYMFSCGSGSKFDVCTEQCVFQCTKEGLFPVASDPNKYYQCYMENEALKYVERNCPVKSQVFDETAQICIYKSN